MNARELTGEALAVWVVRAQGWLICHHPDALSAHYADVVGGFIGYIGGDYPTQYRPDINWSQGGTIIERESIAISRQLYSDGSLREWCAHPSGDHDSFLVLTGATPLEAAMRCYVAMKYGEELPE